MSFYEEILVMKIAFIVTFFPTLSETFIMNQITGLLDSGCDVSIFAAANLHEEKAHPDIEKYHLMDKVQYFFDDTIFRNKAMRVLKAIYLIITNFHKAPLKILKAINVFKYGENALSLVLLYSVIHFLDKEFDIIHCHFGPNGIIGIQLKNIGVSGKVVTTFHGYDMSLFISDRGENVYKKLFLQCDLCMPISNCWKKKLIQLGCNENKIMVHRMGIDLEKFQYSERKIQPERPIKILTLGRLVEKKGHECVIKAVAEVIAKHKNIIYMIAGDGPLRNKLEYLVAELKIKNHVRFLGTVEQDEALKLYQQAHFLILHGVTPSNGEQEGIPVVLMEAQAVGLPVISTYHSGIPELVEDGKTGFLIPEKDVDALAEKLEYLIEHPEIWPKTGRAGREFIEKHYDIKKLNKRLVQIYKGLLFGTP